MDISDDNCVNPQCHLKTRNPGCYVTESPLLTVPEKENTRIIEPRIFAKIWYVEGWISPQSDNSVNPQRHLETRNPGCYVTESPLLTVPEKENTR